MLDSFDLAVCNEKIVRVGDAVTFIQWGTRRNFRIIETIPQLNGKVIRITSDRIHVERFADGATYCAVHDNIRPIDGRGRKAC